MRLTIYSDYALRVLMQVGLSHPRQSSINEIAEAFAISPAHLARVVHELGRAGLLETQRGRGGGIRLGRPAETIVIGEVLRLTESDFAVVACLGQGGPGCRLEPECRLKGAIAEALAAFFAVLDRYSLADLIAPRQTLTDLLGLGGAAAHHPAPLEVSAGVQRDSGSKARPADADRGERRPE